MQCDMTGGERTTIAVVVVQHRQHRHNQQDRAGEQEAWIGGRTTKADDLKKETRLQRGITEIKS